MNNQGKYDMGKYKSIDLEKKVTINDLAMVLPEPPGWKPGHKGERKK